MNAATYSKKIDEDDLQWSTTLNYNNAIGVDTGAVQALKARQDAIDAMYQEGFIKQTEYEAQSLASRQQYDRDLQSSALSSLNTMLSATSSTWSNMTQMIKEKSGEQSGAYKTMFAMQQAFSVTSATINALLAYNQVLASPWTFDPISKQLAASITLGMGMANVGLIAGQAVAGFATGGKIRGAGTPTSDSIPILASDREYMVRAYAAEKLGTPTMDYINKYGELPQNTHRVGMGAVNAIGSGRGGDVVVQPQININVPPGYTAEKRQDANGVVTVDIVRKIAREEAKATWTSLNDPNSYPSKQTRRYTTATPNRK
jgi:hypothetical protein